MSALNGIKVLDLSRLLPGPYCSMMLADYGADVTKIEEPKIGDYARLGYPRIKGISARHLMLNRNKKSITINLKSEKGKEIFKKMAIEADVILESFRPGVMERLGLSYDEISKINPEIVYCSLTGYGQTGPYRDLPGHDINYLGYSGILGLIGERDGKPVVPGVQIADIGGGAFMALSGICMALLSRTQTGKGQYIDVSMMDGAISWQYVSASEYLATKNIPKKGNTRLTGKYACYDVYPTKDNKYLSVGALEDKFWRRFCELIGKEKWISLKDGPKTVQDKLRQDLTELFKQKDQKAWLELLQFEETCVGPVYDLEELFHDPHLLEREMLQEMDHPIAGNVKQIGLPIKFSETPGEFQSHAPLLGEHTEQILSELNYSTEEIISLQREEVIGSTIVNE